MFLAFPLNSKPDWRNPPWMTILLILVNCVIYFGPQRAEEAAWEAAAAYYAHSDLPRLELPRYRDHLRQSHDGKRQDMAREMDRAMDNGMPLHGLELMEWDRAFQAELHAGHIVRPEEPDYALWREQRMKFDRLKGPAFSSRWASNPGDWQPETLVSAAFLHGSTAHLIGNMVFLFAFGFTVELALGRWRYLVFYLLAGAAGEVGDLVARWGSPVIGLGASGAISGLMAMYAMLYGRQRIRFFYQFLFYFDYVRAPAIILLPVWIGHEFFQQWYNGEGGVAYMAHAGGLIGGALLLGLHKWRHPSSVLPACEEPAANGHPEEKAQAEALVKALKLAEARDAYARLVEQRPGDRESLRRYFNLAKLAPGEAHFHRAAQFIFALDGSDAATETLVHEAYVGYWETAKPRPQLGAEQMARLAIRFARAGLLADAERLGALLLRQDPTHHALPSVFLGLIHAELTRGRREQAAAHGETLLARFGGSQEARIAGDLLK